jgi:mono/diheme cytochrome c family protein
VPAEALSFAPFQFAPPRIRQRAAPVSSHEKEDSGMSTRSSWAAAAGLALALGGLAIVALAADKPADPKVARGKYLVEITACNDCHTAGFAPPAGKP